MQLVVDGIDFLGSYSWDTHHFKFNGWRSLDQFVIQSDMSGLDNFFYAFDDR